jgi:CheY-like chemotaxis protein
MSKTLLIAEDDEPNRVAFRDALTADGYHVIAVRDGAAALDAIKHEEVSLLLTEYMLPDITGAKGCSPTC